MFKRVFFLNPPSYEGFDGGAGSRNQAKREVPCLADLLSPKVKECLEQKKYGVDLC
jgi:hypothetical protein